jgi:hypothetical protein
MGVRPLLAIFVLALLAGLLGVFEGRWTERSTAEPEPNVTPEEAALTNAAWYRIAALTVQVDAALEGLLYEHRCRPFESTPTADEQVRFATYALEEALVATRLMWPHVLTLSPLLSKHYWPLRYRLGQITGAPTNEKTELVCRPDFHLIRSRWNLALSGYLAGVTPPFQWNEMQRSGALRRITATFDNAVRTTCHSLDAPDASLTIDPAQMLVLEHSISVVNATFRSASFPGPRQRGEYLLWQGNQRALSDWTYDMNRSLRDGVRRHTCGHLLWHLLRGTYYTWLGNSYEQAEAQRLDLLLSWTQLEVNLRLFCDFPDSPALTLAGHQIWDMVFPFRDVISLPDEFRSQRDEIAAATYAWLPSPEDVRSLQVGDLSCPTSQLQSLSVLLTSVATLPPTD